jgi:DNA polymerase (family 10)
MSRNAALARVFEEMSRVMELLGEDTFKAAAHARAARLIGDMAEDICVLAENREALLALSGIGPKIADKIIEFCRTGGIAEHREMLSRVPAGLLVLLEVPGLGPKTVRVLWKEAGVTDIAGLKRIIEDGSILKLPRMGAKTVERIKSNLALAATASQRLWLGRAWEIAEIFLSRLREAKGVERAEVAGSLRRGRETVGDLDILVALSPSHEKDAARVSEVFRTTPGVTEVIAAGETKSSVRVSISVDAGRWSATEEGAGSSGAGASIQVDLRVLPVSLWGSGLMYFTGSKEHNVRLRERARAMGYTLSEWGLFPLDDEEKPPHERGVRPLASRTEEEIYGKLGLPWIPPEVREGRDEFEREVWRLVEVGDIRAELHSHTTASDGALSIIESAKEARRRGFHTLAVTDHSQSSSLAGGLRPDRLRRHINAIREAQKEVKGIRLLAGSEVDILADGRLDYSDEILAELDIVVASPHTALSQDPDIATERLITAVQHPMVHILGHPTGRLVNRRRGLEPDMAKVIEAAKQHDVALEVNAHWMRLDMRDTHVRLAVDAGCLIAINTDMHAGEDFDNLRFGVMTARRGWCPPEQCINTWDAARLCAWLRKKRRKKT